MDPTISSRTPNPTHVPGPRTQKPHPDLRFKCPRPDRDTVRTSDSDTSYRTTTLPGRWTHVSLSRPERRHPRPDRTVVPGNPIRTLDTDRRPDLTLPGPRTRIPITGHRTQVLSPGPRIRVPLLPLRTQTHRSHGDPVRTSYSGIKMK